MAADTLPQIWVSLVVRGGAFDPDEFTERVGVTPTQSYRAGEPFSNGKGRRRSDGWRLSVEPRRTREVDGMLEELRGLVTIAPAQFRQHCTELGLHPEVLITPEPHSAEVSPSVHFSAEFVAWAAELGALIDVDIQLRALVADED